MPRRDAINAPDASRAADLVVELIGEAAVTRLSSNPELEVPAPLSRDDSPDQAGADPRDWLARVLRAFLTRDELAELQASLEGAVAEPRDLREQVRSLKQYIEEAESSHRENTRELHQELSDKNVEQKRLREDYQRSVSGKKLIDWTFGSDPLEQHVASILRDCLDDPSDESPAFIAAVTLGWVEVRSVLRETQGDEEARMHRTAREVEGFLARLSGLFVPERREVLRRFADCLNAYFDEYEFRSPEDWRQVDPAVHDTSGIGGQIVREGAGFVVLRRSSGQTVLYGRITAE